MMARGAIAYGCLDMCSVIYSSWVCWDWQGRPSASQEPDDNVGGEYAYVWGTNVNIPDVLRAIRRFLNNYRSSPEDLNSKYIQLIEEVGNLRPIWF